jgi:hypothetical protein
MSPAAPTALTISISQVLDLLDGNFASMAAGIGKKGYALWLGSGISRERVDDLNRVALRVLTHLRDRIDPTNPDCPWRRALDEAIDLARLSPTDRIGIDYDRPIHEWPTLETVLSNLSRVYARLLDIRIAGQPEEDYLLWQAVDVVITFSATHAVPDCEHLCIAMLVLEGVLPEIASANWDGLIEAAVNELTKSSGTALTVCVRGEDFREAPLLSRLLKFHGCAVLAGREPGVFRELLIARHSQITDWPHNPAFAVMKHELETLAATKPTLMIGLSAQDSNIQGLFAAARHLMAWTWPCVPPAHVFAEEALGDDQRNILRVVYREWYTTHVAEIEASALFRAFAKPALTGLVLHILFSKLEAFARVVDAPQLSTSDRNTMATGLVRLRGRLASSADPLDRLVFVRQLLESFNRGFSLFQNGSLPPGGSMTYSALSTSPVHMIPSDPTLPTSGVREMASALTLLGLGDADGVWTVRQSDMADPRAGALRVTTGLGDTRVFFAGTSSAAVRLEVNAFLSQHDNDAIVIHSASPVATMARSPSSPVGRTGRIGLRNIAMSELLNEAAGVDELRRRFREEAAL